MRLRPAVLEGVRTSLNRVGGTLCATPVEDVIATIGLGALSTVAYALHACTNALPLQRAHARA